MYSGCRKAVLLCVVCGVPMAHAQPQRFRVCADPNNLPFSNAQEQGFENQLAKLVARDLREQVEFVWTPQRGDFLRKTLNAGTCDAVMGLPTLLEEAETTVPYYRSTYVFVTRRDRNLAIRSFDDARLRNSKIGVQVIGHEGGSVPAAQALMDRGLGENIVWYRLVPDFSRANPPSALIEAVEHGDVDVAIAWGPMAGFFAKGAPVPLRITPVSPQTALSVPLSFDISMGVQRGHHELRKRLNAAIERQRPEIAKLLKEYGIPVSDASTTRAVSRMELGR
jgi:mxaJ protein